MAIPFNHVHYPVYGYICNQNPLLSYLICPSKYGVLDSTNVSQAMPINIFWGRLAQIVYGRIWEATTEE